jgi:hypothetical protein
MSVGGPRTAHAGIRPQPNATPPKWEHAVGYRPRFRPHEIISIADIITVPTQRNRQVDEI